MSPTILQGDAPEQLRTLPDCSVQCCVTSPPYWGLRDYGVTEQIGLEKTPDAYVAKIVEVFREVRRVLKDNGTLWLNLGDSYNANDGNAGPTSGFSAGSARILSDRNWQLVTGCVQAGLKTKRPLRNPVARGLRTPGRRVVSAQ